MRLVGGSAALVRALARGLPEEKVRLGTCVTAMALVEDGVERTDVRLCPADPSLPHGRLTVIVPGKRASPGRLEKSGLFCCVTACLKPIS